MAYEEHSGAAFFATAKQQINKHFPAIRIDHAFVSPEIRVTQVRSSFSPLARMASDHLPLILDFEVEPSAD